MTGQTVVLTGRVRCRADSPPCQELVFDGGRITSRGIRRADVRWHLPESATVLPAFRDPHLHLAAMAAELLSTDCTATVAPDIPSLLGRLREARQGMPRDSWVRGFGFDETLIAERRAPSLAELDSVAPDQPLLLRHRAGYEAFLNSVALKALKDHRTPPDQGRSHEMADNPTGHMIDLESRAQLGLPTFDPGSLESAIAEVSKRLASSGVVEITDAGRRNDVDRVEWLSSLVRRGLILQRTEVMIGGWDIQGARSEGLHWGMNFKGVRVGHAKVIPSSDDDFEREIASALGADWPVAIHATSVEELEGALTCLRPNGRASSSRIEHLSMALPEQLDELSALGCSVVTQPLFPRDRWAKYQDSLEPVELGWLYPVASLQRRGIPFAFSSDGPVSRSVPLEWMNSSIQAREGGLREVATDESIGLATAFAAATGFARRRRGALLPDGAPADLVVLSDDPFSKPTDLTDLSILAVFREGRLIHASDEMQIPPQMYPISESEALT